MQYVSGGDTATEPDLGRNEVPGLFPRLLVRSATDRVEGHQACQRGSGVPAESPEPFWPGRSSTTITVEPHDGARLILPG
jgi:hypothetical protein